MSWLSVLLAINAPAGGASTPAPSGPQDLKLVTTGGEDLKLVTTGGEDLKLVN